MSTHVRKQIVWGKCKGMCWKKGEETDNGVGKGNSMKERKGVDKRKKIK